MKKHWNAKHYNEINLKQKNKVTDKVIEEIFDNLDKEIKKNPELDEFEYIIENYEFNKKNYKFNKKYLTSFFEKRGFYINFLEASFIESESFSKILLKWS
jgi:hypothetical protein